MLVNKRTSLLLTPATRE